MRAKEYLEQLRNLDMEIDYKISVLEEMKMTIMQASAIRYDYERVQSTTPRDRVCDILCDIAELEEQIDEDIDRFADLKTKVVSQIQALPVPEIQRDILMMSYVDYIPHKQIMEKVGRSKSQVYVLKEKALRRFEAEYLL